MLKKSSDSPINLNDFVANLLQEAQRQGATDAEIELVTNQGFLVSARGGSVESVEYNQDKVLDITVYFGQCTGSASISDLRPEAVQAAVKAACHIARFTSADPCAGLADPQLLSLNYPHLDLSHPWNINVEQAIQLACECEALALKQDKRIVQVENVSVATGSVYRTYANTRGFIGSYPVTRHEISCVLIAKAKEEMQRDFNYTVSCDPQLLDSIETVAHKAAQRTVRRLGARRVDTKRVPVIFEAEEARKLLGHFISAISGGSLYRKASFLLDHLNKRVFPASITIKEQPHLLRTLGSAPFDDNGIVTRPNIFVEEGILKQYVLGIYSARKLGLQTTANAGGVHNLSVTHGEKSLPQLLKTMGTGLLVTETMGQGVNLVTGDYSRGAAGFWVENGEIQYPVEEITIAGHLREMYGNLVEIGGDLDTRGNIHTGSILIDNMIVAGS